MKSKLGLLLNRQQRNIKKVHKAAVSIDASAITTEKIEPLSLSKISQY